MMISIPILQCVAEELQPAMFSSKNNKVNFKTLVESMFNPDDVVDFGNKTEFRKGIMQTPFKASASVKVNASSFSVIKAERWKTVMQGIVDSEVRVEQFEYTASQQKDLTSRFGQTLSLEPGTSKNKALRYDVKLRSKMIMPAFGVPMWVELFSTTVRDYFEIGEEVVHVLGTRAIVQENVKTFAEMKAARKEVEKANVV